MVNLRDPPHTKQSLNTPMSVPSHQNVASDTNTDAELPRNILNKLERVNMGDSFFSTRIPGLHYEISHQEGIDTIDDFFTDDEGIAAADAAYAGSGGAGPVGDGPGGAGPGHTGNPGTGPVGAGPADNGCASVVLSKETPQDPAAASEPMPLISSPRLEPSDLTRSPSPVDLVPTFSQYNADKAKYDDKAKQNFTLNTSGSSFLPRSSAIKTTTTRVNAGKAKNAQTHDKGNFGHKHKPSPLRQQQLAEDIPTGEIRVDSTPRAGQYRRNRLGELSTPSKDASVDPGLKGKVDPSARSASGPSSPLKQQQLAERRPAYKRASVTLEPQGQAEPSIQSASGLSSLPKQQELAKDTSTDNSNAASTPATGKHRREHSSELLPPKKRASITPESQSQDNHSAPSPSTTTSLTHRHTITTSQPFPSPSDPVSLHSTSNPPSTSLQQQVPQETFMIEFGTTTDSTPTIPASLLSPNNPGPVSSDPLAMEDFSGLPASGITLPYNGPNTSAHNASASAHFPSDPSPIPRRRLRVGISELTQLAYQSPGWNLDAIAPAEGRRSSRRSGRFERGEGNRGEGGDGETGKRGE